MAWSEPKTDFVQRIVGSYIREQEDTKDYRSKHQPTQLGVKSHNKREMDVSERKNGHTRGLKSQV